MTEEEQIADYKARRERDERCEKVIHEYLYYLVWKYFSKYEKVEDAERQKLGMDVIFIGKDGVEYICDEKAVTGQKYFNSKYPLRTFVMELYMRSLSKNGKWISREGWFLNKSLKTNLYCLVWVDKVRGKDIFKPEDILDAEVLIVPKKSIEDFLNKIGWTEEMLIKQKDMVLQNPSAYYKTKYFRIKNGEVIEGKIDDDDSIGFNTPYKLHNGEAPINALLTREQYRALAIWSNKEIKKKEVI